MKLTQEIARDINIKMKDFIPYNINIMDEQGIIIASGDKKRLGTIHMGASQAIKKKGMVSILDHSSNIKPGVNMPILFQDKIIGVIGITGVPGIVEPFAALVKGTAELLVSQAYVFKERRGQEQLREEFLFQWTYRKEAYDHDFISQGKDLGVDIIKPRKVLYIEGADKNKLRLGTLGKDEYGISLSKNTCLILLQDSPSILSRASQLIGDLDVKAGLSNRNQLIRKSFRQGRKALSIANQFKIPGKLIEFNQLAYIDRIVKGEEDEKLLEIFYDLEKTDKGLDLIHTLGAYIFNDGQVQEVSNQLHIHRNSLGYRMAKIEEATGLNPRKYRDLYQLMTAFIQYKMKNKENNSSI